MQSWRTIAPPPLELGALFGIHHRLEHLPKARHRRRPRCAISRAHPRTLGVRQLAFERRPRRSQVQVPLAPVLAADARLDEAIGHERAQHPVQRLLGDAEDVDEVRDRGAGAAADEVDGAVVGAAGAILG